MKKTYSRKLLLLVTLSPWLLVNASAAPSDKPTFTWDVLNILTNKGCNGSSCHGGVKGRGGFKLSLGGINPSEDYRWIVKGGTYEVLREEPSGLRIPRIKSEYPEESLLLLKPTHTVDHMGGELFGIESSEYKTILEWIRQGARYESEDKPPIQTLEVSPSEAVLYFEEKQQLKVTALLNEGHRVDITAHVRYVSGNTDVIKVSPDGVVHAISPGETAVIIRAPGHVSSARFGVVAKPLENFPQIPRENFIDEYIFAKLRKFHILPSHISSDAEFLRRVCLDVTGTLPPPRRAREFLADKSLQKRAELIETLLNTPEYVDYWTFRIADLFRVALYPAGNNPKFSRSYWEWLRKSVAENRPYDEIARERIAAQGYDGASRHYLPILQPPLPPDAMAEEVRVFSGRRLDCAQCHDHPFENWTQNQFWGLTAFFRRLTFYWFLEIGTEALVLDDPDGYSRRGNMGKVIHPRTGREAEPQFLDGTLLAPENQSDPRMALANWMTAHPYFAETAVNRVWSYFFGRGIVDPVDDFRSDNPPTHPRLLQALAEDFRRNGHDLKRLIRLIVQSRTYQLSSATNERNENDRINYSRAVPRPLDAEILLDAISYVSGVPEVFVNQRGGRAPLGTRAIELKEPDLYPSRFLEIYGRPTRERLPERRSAANLSQALHRLVGQTYVGKLSSPESHIGRLLERGASDSEIIEELYLAALTRFPTNEEQAALTTFLAEKPSRREALEDILWALINSEEFRHNH